MKLNLSQKQKIAARLFYFGNQDDYANLESAFEEFSANNLPESFLDSVVSPMLKRDAEYTMLFNDKIGAIVGLRESDDFLQPITPMDEKENIELVESFKAYAEMYESLATVDIFKEMGWNLLPKEQSDDK